MTFVLLSLLKDSPKKKIVSYTNSSKTRTTVLCRKQFFWNSLSLSHQTSKALIFPPHYISCAPHWRTAWLSRTTNTCHFFCPFFPCHPIPCTPLRLRIQRGTRALKQHLSWSKAVGRWIKQGIVWEEKEGRAIQWVRCLMDPCDVSVPEAHSTEAQQLSFKSQSNPGEYRASQCHHKARATPLPDLLESSLLFSVFLAANHPLGQELPRHLLPDLGGEFCFRTFQQVGQLFRNRIWHKYLFFPPSAT